MALRSWLEKQPAGVVTVVAMFAAFATYFCMYAFRKPFAAASFEGQSFGDAELKTAFVIAQLLGYTLSKFMGIRINAELPASKRFVFLVALIATAEVALIGFGLLPPSLMVVAMFLNGMPLGMVWGIVVSYLEGRQTSEVMLAGLSCSFIIASGVVKSVGAALVTNVGVSQEWMPALVGLIFFPPLLVSAWILEQTPRPTREDEEARSKRCPMKSQQRLAFIKEFIAPLAFLVFVYFFLTAYRDFRDNYAAELFVELGFAQEPQLFAITELPVAFGVMAVLATLSLVKDNKKGLLGAYAIMCFGAVLIGIAGLLLQLGLINGVVWMILTGLGSYLAYVPFGSVLFDRIIAYTRVAGTAVFAIYLADALGYTGSIAVQLYRDLFFADSTRLNFFLGYGYGMAIFGVVALLASYALILNHSPPTADARTADSTPPS